MDVIGQKMYILDQRNGDCSSEISVFYLRENVIIRKIQGGI
jgi:hypothetical protein